MLRKNKEIKLNDSSFGDLSFEDLYKKYFVRIATFIRLQYDIESDVSQDLAQEVFGILWQKKNDLIFNNEKQIVCWMYETAKIKAKEYNRLNAVNKSLLSLDSEEFSKGITVSSEKLVYLEIFEDQNTKYQKYLSEIKLFLNKKELALFECIVEKEMSQREAADYLGITDVNLRVRWHRIRLKLKPIIDKMMK